MKLMDALQQALLMTSKEDVAIKLSEAKRIAEEYAEHKAKMFGRWLSNLPTIDMFTVHPPSGSGGSTGIYYKSMEDLYKEFEKWMKEQVK